MGANKPFDIDELCRIARPTHGIITNIGKAHLEGFLSFEGVLKTKSELYDHVAANSGVVFVNSDDAVLTNALASRKVKVHSFGEQNGEIRGELTFLNPFVHFRWSQENYSSPLLATQMIGKYNFTNFLAAISIGLHFGVAPEKLNAALCAYVPNNKRSQVEQGISNTLIVDCYNANPSSMASALDSFIEMKHENKLVLLGDMLELGADGPAEHHKIIEFLKQHQLAFHTVGPLFKAQHQNGFETTSDLVAYLNENPPKNSLILLKGSRGIALEQTLDVLRAN
jgi:UDP-N-acetylmuramoyl-tripeptide--D-alanyl-D-alanine ligase